MTQKVLKVGTSLAITLSKEARRVLGITAGDQIDVEIDKKSRTVRIKPTQELLSADDREVLKQAQDFANRYQKDLDELARL